MILKFIRVGSHRWVPDIDSAEIGELALDPRMERFLDHLDKFNDGVLYVYFVEQRDIVLKEGLLQFSEESILRFMTTNDDFQMDIFVEDHAFKLSSILFMRLEQACGFNFCENIYRIEVHSYNEV